MSRAGPRWAGETVMPSIEAPVVLDIDRTLITLEDAELRSPRLSKPMQHTESLQPMLTGVVTTKMVVTTQGGVVTTLARGL
jgi:hypothetical protein